jgi:hypothetical protein
VKHRPHDDAHRIHAELVDMYKRRARRLRREACRELRRAMWRTLRWAG